MHSHSSRLTCAAEHSPEHSFATLGRMGSWHHLDCDCECLGVTSASERRRERQKPTWILPVGEIGGNLMRRAHQCRGNLPEAVAGEARAVYLCAVIHQHHHEGSLESNNDRQLKLAAVRAILNDPALEFLCCLAKDPTVQLCSHIQRNDEKEGFEGDQDKEPVGAHLRICRCCAS